MIVTCVDFYPLIVMSISESATSRDDIDAMFARFHELAERAIQRGTYHASVCITRGTLTATERKYVAELTDKVPSAELERTVASYVVIESSMLRGALTALRWLSPKLVMVEHASSIDEALDGCKARLDERGSLVAEDAVRGARAWLQDQTRPARSSR